VIDARAAADPVLHVECVSKRFGSRRVLTSASLTARPGRITALLGRNGSGKTTLLRIAGGVIPADQGTIRFRGRMLDRPAIHRLSCDGLFFLPERDLLARNLRVREHLDLMARRCGAASRAASVAAEMALTECADRLPNELSGGERRRAELALIELRAPACLLADEPFMGVAPHDAELTVQRLRRLAGRGCAIVVTGHEVRTLLAVADDVVWVTSGTTHGLGTPGDAADNWQFRREYLGA
jgi:ABC-type multidrug transport system ATPase subunit